MTIYIQTNQVVFIPDGVYNVNSNDSGKLMISGPLTANRLINLPPVAAGLHYRFIETLTTAFTSTLRPRNAAGGVANTLVQGLLINAAAAGGVSGVPKTNADTVTFLIPSVLGDFIDCYSDGTYWHVHGVSSVIGGLA